MTTEEDPTNERSHYEALLEDMKREFKVLSEAQVANTEGLQEVRAETDRRFKEIDRRVMVLEVKDIELGEKVGAVAAMVVALDGKVDRKVGALDAKLVAFDKKIDRGIAALDERVDTLDTKVGTLYTMVGMLDAKVDQRLHALEMRVGSLDSKIRVLNAQLSYELSRIAIHLGLGAASRPAGQL